MSMKRLATLSSTTSNHGGLNETEMSSAPGSPPPPIHGVNVMLGGAMLSGIILAVFIMCYCCHKNARKQEAQMPTYWRGSGLPLHVYTVEGHQGQQCYDPEEFECELEVAPPASAGPPPAYDAVVPIHNYHTNNNNNNNNNHHYHLQQQQHHYTSVSNTNNKHSAVSPARVRPADDSGLPSYEAALRLQVGHV